MAAKNCILDFRHRCARRCSAIAKGFLDPPIEVQIATATLTSPAQANAVLTASGYVVARRKVAVASKGTGTLVFLGGDSS